MVTMHGTCVLISGIGVLLRGASGSGKSDLALRLIDEGARLVSDDQISVRVEGDRLIATPPPPLAGYLEVRGVGIMPVPSVASAEIGLIVDLVPRDRIERLPDVEHETILSVALPHLTLHPFDASATAKLRLAVVAARDGALGAIPVSMAAYP
jgi:HPr kinase/phosphorylase